jgi:site-specific DNA recombinase
MSVPSQNLKPAFAYERVSSRKQLTEGNGLSSQYQENEETAKRLGCKIIEHFHDDAISGGDRTRKGIEYLLDRCKLNKGCHVIFPATSRLARDVLFLLSTVQTLMKDYDCTVIFPNLEGVDLRSPIGKFILTTAGGTDELHKDVNTEQTSKRRLARQQQGYYIDYPPNGYNKVTMSPDRIITINENTREYYKAAFDGYLSGRFSGYTEIQNFLNESGIKIRKDQVKVMLANPVYAGYLNRPKLNINMLKANHEALVDLSTHYKIIAKMTNTKPTPIYSTVFSFQFPFRGIVKCCGCHNNLTSGTVRKTKATNEVQAIDYYWCTNRKCELKSKTISATKLEDTVINYLAKQRLSQESIDFLIQDVKDQKKAIIESNAVNLAKLRTEIIKLDDERNKILDKIINSDNSLLVDRLEKKLEENQEVLIAAQKSLAVAETQETTKGLDVLNPLFNISKTLDLTYINSTNADRVSFLKLVFPAGFEVEKVDNVLNVLNHQKSPLLRDYWTDCGLEIRFGGAVRTDFEPLEIYQELLEYAEERRDLILIFSQEKIGL